MANMRGNAGLVVKLLANASLSGELAQKLQAQTRVDPAQAAEVESSARLQPVQVLAKRFANASLSGELAQKLQWQTQVEPAQVEEVELLAQVEPTQIDDEDEELEAMMQENEALQAENEALKLEMRQAAVTFDFDEEVIEPTAEEEAARLQVHLEALRREREALQKVVYLGEELQDFQGTNIALREATRQLAEENSRLQAAAPRAVGSRATASRPAAGASSRGGDVPLDVLDKRVHDLILCLGYGNRDVLATCNQRQRSEIVTELLKKGLFDPLSPEVVSPTNLATPTTRVPAASKATKTAQATVGAIARPTPAPVAKRIAGNMGPAVGDTRQALWPVSMGPAKEVAEAIRRGDSQMLNSVSNEQKKEMIANMLKTGLFCAPPGPIRATAADDLQMDLVQETRSRESAGYQEARKTKKEMQGEQMTKLLAGYSTTPRLTPAVASSGAPTDVVERRGTEGRFAQELALRNKLQKLRT